MKNFIHQIHLWLGLIIGSVVFIVSITGCIYVFQKEIQDYTQTYRFAAEQQGKPYLPPSAFEKVARKTLPQYHLHAVMYPGKGRSVQSIFYGFDPEHYYTIYHDPYTAEVIHVQNMYKTFFQWILTGHYYLWLPPAIGQPIVSYSTLVFVAMLLTGIILWWPKNRAAAKQRFWFRWKSSTQWKRKNYDLHNILGFYTSWLLLVVALTGMVFGLQWLSNTAYAVAGGDKSLVYAEAISSKDTVGMPIKPAIDLVWEKMVREHPNAVSIEVHTIESDSSAISANANTRSGVYWTTDYRYFDQYTLQELEVNHLYGRLKDATSADKLMRMNYDIHVGAILGLPGKILAFLLSLTAASLPVTGVTVWLGRRKRKRKLLTVKVV